MRKLLTAILCIALAIALLGCDEKKAKDAIIKKAIDKTVAEADKNTANTQGNTEGKTPTIKPTKPVLSAYRVRVGTSITFPKVAGHTYALKPATSSVTLSDVEGDSMKKQVSSTKAISGVVVVATLDGNTIESQPIEFFLLRVADTEAEGEPEGETSTIELTKPVLSAYRVRAGTLITFPKVAGHTYTVKHASGLDISSVTLSDVEGDSMKKQVSSTKAISGVVVVATLDGNTIESQPIEFFLLRVADTEAEGEAEGDTPPPAPQEGKPALSSYRVRVGKVATFKKVTGYTYVLKTVTKGVTLSDVVDDTTKKQVGSTEKASGIIVVATKDGTNIESDSIEFFLLHVANKKALQDEIKRAIKEHGNNVNLNYIDTSEVTDMSSLFYISTFNGDISKWNTSSVTNMSNMFRGATKFNQSLNTWTVSKVTNMSNMFRGATAFNQQLNSWNVSSVREMSRMFQDATAFNQSLNSWTVSSVTDMSHMFRGATAFNQQLNSWNVSSVTDMREMFYKAKAFNQSLKSWSVAKVRNMSSMFYEAKAFNQQLNSWNVSSVTDMREMFYSAWAFNQPLNSWNVSSVEYMGNMFRDARAFNQNLSSWVLSGREGYMFVGSAMQESNKPTWER